MTRRWKFITYLAAGTSITAAGLGLGLGLGLKNNSQNNSEITPNYPYEIYIDGKKQPGIESIGTITYQMLLLKINITYDNNDNWVKYNHDGTSTYYRIAVNGNELLTNQWYQNAVIGRYDLNTYKPVFHTATIAWTDDSRLWQTKTWTGDRTYEQLFSDVLKIYNLPIIVENGKWVTISGGTSMEWIIKFNDKEILASSKDEIAQDGTYYFSN